MRVKSIIPLLMLLLVLSSSMITGGRGQKQRKCTDDSDCGRGHYCRDLPPKDDELVPTERACVPYQRPFESCEGYTFSWLMEHCDSRKSDCVSLDPLIEDAPGVCLVRCSEYNNSCPRDMFCDSTGQHCLSDNLDKSDFNCLVDADCDLTDSWIHPECVGYAVCNNNGCGWVCGERPPPTPEEPPPSSPPPAVEEPRMGSSSAPSSATVPVVESVSNTEAAPVEDVDYVVSPKRVQKRTDSTPSATEAATEAEEEPQQQVSRAQPVGGGWKPIDLKNNTDPRLDKVVEFCVNYLNENNHKDGASDEENAKLPPKTLHQVQSASRKIVAGTVYRVVLDTLTGFDNPLEVHEFEVFLTLTHELKMLEHEFLSSSVLHTCALPKTSGICQISLPRWFYNVETSKCEPFRFGCGGNANNFGTQEECLATCASYNP